jgi:hypothetical protein
MSARPSRFTSRTFTTRNHPGGLPEHVARDLAEARARALVAEDVRELGLAGRVVVAAAREQQIDATVRVEIGELDAVAPLRGGAEPLCGRVEPRAGEMLRAPDREIGRRTACERERDADPAEPRATRSLRPHRALRRLQPND